LPIDYRWNGYKKAKAHANKTAKAVKSSNWRRAVAATAYDQKNPLEAEKMGKITQLGSGRERDYTAAAI
jgi:hypothetical protein